MNAVQPSALQLATTGFLARFEGNSGLRANPLRRRAAETLRHVGLPTQREEAWHFTSLRPLAGVAFQGVHTLHDHGRDMLARLADISGPRIVFVNGRHDAAASEMPDFTTVGEPALDETDDAVSLLNTMFADDGAHIEIPPGVDHGSVLLASIGLADGEPVAFHPRHRVRLHPGARLTLIDVSIGRGTYLNNPVFDIEVAEGATLTHLRLQDDAIDAFHLSSVRATVATRGTYDSFALTLGARLARMEVHAHLTGEHGAAHLNAAQLLGGIQHADFTTVVAHDAPSCASRQTVKNVLTGKSRGVFQGRIEVARIAQKTDGYQMNQALLLSPDAEIDSKPQLQIYADDVKCSHGATVGELDLDQLFYLRSRGIPEPDARAILVRAFLAEALDPITHDETRALMETAIESWWQGQHP